MPRPAFTLIELLVVITIIVVLLALLTPALDKAIYSAELAACGARLHMLGSGTVTYASGNKRFYMERFVNGGMQPAQLRRNPNNTDFRPALARAFDVNALNDPLVKAVDLESNFPEGKNRTDWDNFSSYNIFVGWSYLVGAQEVNRKMRKMGDYFNWTDTGTEYRFRILFSDRDVILPDITEAQSSHPDRQGRMHNMVAQDEPGPWVGAVDQATDFKFMTISLWRLAGSYQRGVVDDQFLYDDLSMRRITDVVADNAPDERMAPVPVFNGGGTDNRQRWIHLPKD